MIVETGVSAIGARIEKKAGEKKGAHERKKEENS